MKTKSTTKKIMLAAMTIGLAICAMTLLSCGRGSSLRKDVNLDKDASYAIGMSFGYTFVTDGIVPNMNEFVKGMTDMLAGKETRFTEQEAMVIIQTAIRSLMLAKESENMEKEIAFLEENRRRPGVIETESGLQYEILVETTGRRPTASDLVQAHFEGSFIDGEVFESSYNYGEPMTFHLGGVIPGWTEGLQLMSVGSKFRFYIPSELAYGHDGSGRMPPFTTLIFDLELISIVD